MRGIKKQWYWAVLLIALCAFCTLSNDPLNDFVNFLIGGSIPGTHFSIGFWSTIAFAGALLFGLLKIFRGLKLQMLEHTANQIKAEQAKQDFAKNNSGDSFTFNRSQRSVIAAPSQD